MLSYCVLSATPAFQFLVTELEPKLGDRANKEAFRDYMEYGGKLREASEILAKLNNDYFSTTTTRAVTITGGQDNEITDMTQAAKFKNLGIGVPKKQISSQQIINLKKIISAKNNDFVKEGIDRVYTLETKQVGEPMNDNFTWELKVYKGKLDVPGKSQRISDTVLDKNRLPSPLAQGSLDLFASQPLDNVITESNYSQQIIRKMAEAMGEQLGVDYAFITGAEAKELTKGSVNPWSGQKAFFFQGKAYFIEGQLSPDDILHEFVHPVIKSIAKQNRPLFNALYDKAALSEEGSRVIEEVMKSYPDLDIKGDDFKEEILVRSLAKIQDLNNKGLQVSSEFEKFVNNLLYAIKQFLRKIFGQKIKVSELSPDTTLKGLSKMLEEGESFELDPEIITDKDLVAYKNEYTKYMEDFVAENADQKEIEKLTNEYFNTVAKQLQSLREKNDLGALADILQNEYKTGELQKMKQNLKSYQTLILQDSKKMEDEVELTRQRTQAIINSLGNVDNMVKKIYEGLRELVKDVDNPDNVQRALYYQKVLNYWSDFVNTANATLERNGIDNIKMVNNVTANTRKANDLMDDFYRKASQGVLWEKLKVSAENIDQKWKERIAELTAKNAPQDQIDKANRDYQNEKITPAMIEQALKGELKDLNFANAYLEGYGYSPDPVVGGLALFVKDKITEVEAVAQKNFNEAAVQLKPLLDKVGYNPNNPGKLGQDLGQKEKVGRVNTETGEFEEVEVWRFLNEFSGADLARDQYLFKIKTASAKYNETGTDEDKKALADIQAEWEQHRRDYFHNEYTEAFYQAYDILKKDAIGNEARMQMNNLYDELNLLSGQMTVATAADVLEIADQVEVVRRQIKQLSSLYDLAGNLKTGDALAIAKRLQEFNDAVKDIYEQEEIPGSFQTALQSFEQKLLDEGKKKGETDYETLRTKWLEKNTRIAIKDTFWAKMDLISKAINDILSTLPQQDASKLEIEEAYQVIKEMVKGHRDESGQPLGSEMSPERQEKIKAAQERINEARENLNRLSGLTKQEQGEVSAIMLKFQTGQKVSTEEQYRLNQLLSKQSSLKLDKIQRAELNSLFAEMDELRAKEATDSYVDTVNDLLGAMNSEAVYDIINGLGIDKSTAFLLGNSEIVQKLKELSPEFEEWFNRNHIMRESVDMETNEVKEVWDRTYAWNVIKPRDEKYYETTKIRNAAGEVITIEGLPSLKYFKRLVKDEYITEKIEGVTTDNRGYWLPKNMSQGAKDDRYINTDYARMRQSNPNMFNLLEKMKEIHLKNQVGLNKKGKLYLDMPRYRKQTVERLRSENPVQRVVQRVKDFWGKVKDGWEQGFNYDDNMQLIKMDLFDDNTTGIPISGISNLAIEEVSTDIAFTTMRYMLAATRNKQLTEIAPMARMIQATVNNKKNYPLESKILNNSTIVNMGRKKDKYLRARAVNNFLERVLEGKENTGAGSESAIAQNVSRQIFKRAGSAYLDFNIPSAIKNALSAKFQTMIEASAGKHLSWKDFMAAEKDATVTTMTIMSEIYKQGPKSVNAQLVEIFDPERDRFHYAFGEALTRTPGKDYSFLIMNRLNDFRKTTQLQASLQTLFGMMRHEIIKTADGKAISYRDAWEVKDGKIQLKPNVPAEWGITYNEAGEQIIGEKFKQKRNQYQRVIDNLNGNFGREERPEADRYLLFRYVSFFRRFFTSMLMNRFAYSGSLRNGTSRGRYDYALGDTKQGFYIEFLKLIGNTFRNKFRNIPYMSSEEKSAAMRVLTEVGTVSIINFLVLPLIFGFDDDDEDRFKKLKAKSGALPAFGVVDDPTRPFDIGGWLSNHMLLSLMSTNGEGDQFIPFPGYGLNNYKQMLDVKSVAFGPTIKTAFDLIQDVAYLTTGNEKAYYQKDAGAYEFNQEGDPKLYNHLAKAFGFNSSTMDPAKAIQLYQNAQGR